MVQLYSTNCPRCNVLEKKLIQKNINFTKIIDFDPKKLIDLGFSTAPVCCIDNNWYDYKDTLNYINNM